MASSVLLRRARFDEASVIADVQTRSWKQTYARDVPADQLEQLRIEPTQWEQRIDEAGRVDSPIAIMVAEVDDAVVGFAACGPDRDDDQLGQLYAIYVLRSAQGMGVGRRLHEAVLAALGERGFREATLWVLASNASARRFYEIADWRTDGATGVEHALQAELPTVRYRRRLDRESVSY